MIQLRTLQTQYDSVTNPTMYKFVLVRGLCGLGAEYMSTV